MATLLDVIAAASGFVRDVAVVAEACAVVANDDLCTFALLAQSGGFVRYSKLVRVSARLIHACLMGDEARVHFLCERGKAHLSGSLHIPLLLGVGARGSSHHSL